MPKPNDTQTILLSAASQRDGGSLYRGVVIATRSNPFGGS